MPAKRSLPQQRRQLGGVRRDPPRLIAGEWLRCFALAGRSERVPVGGFTDLHLLARVVAVDGQIIGVAKASAAI
jgi:hypothetical protein